MKRNSLISLRGGRTGSFGHFVKLKDLCQHLNPISHVFGLLAVCWEGRDEIRET